MLGFVSMNLCRGLPEAVLTFVLAHVGDNANALLPR
jgi:hypothetical protein